LLLRWLPLPVVCVDTVPAAVLLLLLLQTGWLLSWLRHRTWLWSWSGGAAAAAAAAAAASAAEEHLHGVIGAGFITAARSNRSMAVMVPQACWLPVATTAVDKQGMLDVCCHGSTAIRVSELALQASCSF
jgi:hypothetical protein